MESSETVTQGIGRVVIPVVLMLWGMHRCQALAEMPNVNPQSTRGLMYSLGAWVLMLLNTAFVPLYGMYGWVVSMVALAGVIVLGVIGTIQSLRGMSRWNDYQRGNTHGVFGLLIGAGLPVLIVVGLIGGFVRS